MNIPCHAALNATSHEEAFLFDFHVFFNTAVNNVIAFNVLYFNVLFALFNEIDT